MVYNGAARALGPGYGPTIREILDSTKFTRACSGVVPARAIDFLYGEALLSRG
jgi:hypothetical protein